MIDEHMEHFKNVIEQLTEHSLLLNAVTSVICTCRRYNFLGHKIAAGGKTVMQKGKLQAIIIDWQPLRTSKENYNLLDSPFFTASSYTVMSGGFCRSKKKCLRRIP